MVDLAIREASWKGKNPEDICRAMFDAAEILAREQGEEGLFELAWFLETHADWQIDALNTYFSLPEHVRSESEKWHYPKVIMPRV